MHHVTAGWILLLLVLLVALPGCVNDSGHEYSGVGITFMHDRPEDGRSYHKIWSNEYPDDYTYPDGSVGSPGVEDDCGGPGHSGFCTQFVFTCSTPEKPYREHSNFLAEIYLGVSIYELERTMSGRATAGEEIESNRWDGLQCFKGYTLVLTQGPDIELYRCNDCRDKADRQGLEPLEPSDL